MTHRQTQDNKTLEYLQMHGTITHKLAVVELNIMDVHKCIGHLDRRGYNIERNWKERVNQDGHKVRWMEYKLVD